ncbi:MAG TPA: PmoA family protein [Flavitalea sp.]|nr:PmoA family protein [Flavitalea sp.]
MHRYFFVAALSLVFLAGCKSGSEEEIREKGLRAEQNEQEGTISVFRAGGKKPVLVQHARADFRPYIHPIVAPDGKGVLTEYSPGHHKHQTGLYWGFTRVNGRDFFHHPEGDYWRKVSATVLEEGGVDKEVKWQTVYDMLDSAGQAILRETQIWTMKEDSGKFLISLEWQGEAQTDITIGQYDYGGLFLRMPWHKDVKGEVVNTARQKNGRAEGQRAMWVDVGMQVEGRDDFAHIAIFDHPENKDYPQMWRVDSQMGVGPARARAGDWFIKKGETETIRHGLSVYTGDFHDIEVTKTWEKYTGQSSLYSTASLWQIAQKEGLEAKFLTPEEAAKNMELIDGYKVNVWAAEPMMTQPMAFCWDDRGRLWIAENLDYESRGHGFSNDGNSRILILEDTDQDGVADKSKVFMEGIPFPAAIAVGFDGVYIGAPPNLIFVPDRNGDDIADTKDIEVKLTGWGIRDRHETLNSLHWGPDGWLYGLQGFATPSKVRKPEGKGKLYKHKDPFPEDILEGEGVDINGGVWRYHPVKDRFEVVAHGFSNPWGIDYDAKGQLFISACVIPHLWHVIPGGIYHRQGGRHFNPYVYNDIKTIADHSHRSAHGGARVYLSDAFPESQRGRIFMANIHEHGVLSDVLIPKGSGFTGRHGDDFMMANNAQFVGFSMEIGPDGALYVLDWHDADICGKEVLNKETGRIFRIAPEQSLAENWPGRYSDLTKMSDRQLADLQTNKSEWHARRARVILQNRAAKGVLDKNIHEPLRKLFLSSPNADWRLRAMWTLHATGGFNAQALVSALKDKDEYVRAWAIQLLCEDGSPSPEIISLFTKMAKEDRSPVVRLYLASALQRVDRNAAWSIAAELIKRGEDKNDHNLPDMIWFGLEPLVKENPDRALSLAATAEIPILAEYIARRAMDADAIETLISWIGRSPKTLGSLLEGMRDGLEGRYDLPAPASWKSVYAKLSQSRDPQVSKLSLAVSQQFGDAESALRFMATLKNRNAPIAERQQAIQAIANRQREELIAEIPALLNEPAMRAEAIRAIAAYDNEPLGKLLLSKYKSFNSDDKLQAIQTLSSRPKYGWMLSQALAKKEIPKTDVPGYAARQLLRVVGSGFIEVWGPMDSKIDEKEYNHYKKLLTDKAISESDPLKGREVYMRACGPCHKMYGEGGIIGPDLTGSNRRNIDYLLGNILDPSGEIQDDYKMVVVTTRDGRTYAGNVASENDRQLTMRIVGKDAVIINKSDIQSREETAVSMMPEGLLKGMKDEDALALFAYFRTVAPVHSQ